MNDHFVENIFILSVKKYEDFSIISALSKKLGRARFSINNSLLKSSEKFDSGLLIQIKYKTQGNFSKIFDYKLFFSFNIDNIEYQRLFAVQSIASLIERFIINIDNINIITQYIPKIISIFYEKNWIDLYIKIELKILSLYFDLNQLEIKNLNESIKLKKKPYHNIIYHDNINNKVEIFNFCLQKLDDIWYNFDNKVILPKERIVFKKILINFLVK